MNDIREDEKIVKDPVFQWRCHRLLNLTNLHLYDHSNQDKELRSKVRKYEKGEIMHNTFSILYGRFGRRVLKI